MAAALGFSLVQMAAVRPSEANAEFPSTSDALWNLATAHEWSLIETEKEEGLFPFLVASATPGQRPYQRRRPVEEHFGADSVGRSVYSDEAITAFLICSSTARAASAASPSLLVQPLVPCAKIVQGLLEAVSARSPPAVLHVTLSGFGPASVDDIETVDAALRRPPSVLRDRIFWTTGRLCSQINAALAEEGDETMDELVVKKIYRRREMYQSALADGVRMAGVSDIRVGTLFKGMTRRRDITVTVNSAPDGWKSMVAVIVALSALPRVSCVFATPGFDNAYRK